ncbi:C6 zinc finger domain containing protein [Pleurostoma richardsiae]|uniref:C6 zinc finger domain containing protein n=1 Tax=Pleurostoma richardsiae TaxID=41990 RepID=A0AA38RUJ5_9PEZI|nr:C6 zinc finger domain containing protein [Pleurostoma richardsiae]
MSGTAAARSRTACTPCTRRKVKCSKTFPCNNCVRRGEQDFCNLEATHPPSPATPVAARIPSTTPRPTTHQGEIDFLRRRVAELEDRAHTSAAESTQFHPSPAERGGMPPVGDAAPASSPLTEHATTVVEPADEPPEANDAVIKDAASILEFLAWGRRKDPECNTVGLPKVTLAAGGASGDVSDLRPADGLAEPFGDRSSLAFMQLLLPSRDQVWQLVDYHQECLLWYHGSYFAPTFRSELDGFYERYRGSVESPGVNLQWVALLFAVMSGSLTCAPTEQAQAWGFRDPERETLCKRWFQAAVSCLNRAEYASNHSILSCQAIATLTISAHLLGFSNMQSVMLAAAVRIAQSLGLHRLGPGAPGGVVQKETGRRVWSQLCSQDWFSIPFSESYLVNPLYSQSTPPANCHDEDMLSLPDNEPTITGYCRFLSTVASLMPQLQDGLLSCNTPYTRYEQVLKWDARLRTLATVDRPIFLANQVPIEPHWPRWIPWARRALAISSGHKIIMIHRSCLSESFTNPAFAFTRRTCLAASKTIIKEYKAVAREDGPILWIHQAFSVAASIILILDVLHRVPGEREHAEHKQLVEEIVEILGQCCNSMIAARGIKLLRALLDQVARISGDEAALPQGQKRRRGDDGLVPGGNPQSPRRSTGFNVPEFVKAFCEGNGGGAQQQPSRPGRTVAPPGLPALPGEDIVLAGYGAENSQQPGEGDLMDFGQPDVSSFFLPPGLEVTNGFENLLYLANHDFSF